MRDDFEAWLIAKGYDPKTISTRKSNIRRLESAYGDLVSAFAEDGFESIRGELEYTKIDERNRETDPSRLGIDGNLYNSLSHYRSVLNSYASFLSDTSSPSVLTQGLTQTLSAAVADAVSEQSEAKLSLERDLQAALRRSIEQLEPGLQIADGGSERSVPSGRIDILAKDAGGVPVIIELKVVTAPRDAVAQVLAYMGDIQGDIDGPVRGMLVAPDFDARAISAARMVPSLSLFSFRFSFQFDRRG